MKIFLIISIFITYNAARKGFGPGEQDWGFLEVRPGAHIFWWFFYTTAHVTNPEERPLVLWIQGGPGIPASGIGNFQEFGPLDMNLKPRKYCWMKDVNVLLIDSPVGTGFSYVNNTDLLCKNNDEIVKDLLTTLKQFYKKFPKFRSVPLYVASQSYGGKVSAQFAYYLFQEIENCSIRAVFKGLWFASPFITPCETTLSYAPFLYNMGILDANECNKVNKLALSVVRYLEEGDYSAAQNLTLKIIRTSFGKNQVHTLNVLNKMRNGTFSKQFEDVDLVINELMDLVKCKLSIPPNISFGKQAGDVYTALYNDILAPVTEYVEKLLNDTDLKIFILTGQLDSITPMTGTVQGVHNLNWTGNYNFNNSPRMAFLMDDIVEGYFKSYGPLSLYWIYRSGHMIPVDNPATAYETLRLLTNDFKG